MVACDFFVVITATFRTLYVFVVMEMGSRQILHHNVTAHPTAEWTVQQLREARRAIIRTASSSTTATSSSLRMSTRVLQIWVYGLCVRQCGPPKANAVCERLGGSLRRECLDFLIPFNERHLQMIIRDWTMHYNRGRPHSSRSACAHVGPGPAQRAQTQAASRASDCEEIRARRLASRIWSCEGGCLATDFIFCGPQGEIPKKMVAATLHRLVAAKHLFDGAAQCLGSVDHEQVFAVGG
jgi:hypothetical protein